MASNSSISPELYRKAKEIVPEAAEMAPLERAAYLDRVCQGDDALRREVESLLSFTDTRSDAFTEDAIARERAVLAGAWGSSAGFALDTTELRVPESVGPYRVVRLLGAGGMGVVYEARQEHPQRTIALKVLRPGLFTPRLIRRFEHEAETLAQLQHPGIAHIYETGSAQVHAPDGAIVSQPFFAMELVHGEPLTAYAKRRKLDTRERLQLMARVCDAVEHAHQKGVIHRDLKPANILVDETSQPKVLDFGVARATNADLQITTMHTQVNQVVGTLAYMSPEQADGRADQLDTRSDVYALGVILYELLAERLPYDLTDKPLTAAARIIAEQPPTPLSSVDRALRGDLNTIVLKAIEKTPARRYSSAADLAADIRRFLNREPITAHPPSFVYQCRMFAKRRRGVVIACGVAAIAIIAGVALATREAVRAARADRIARAVNDFLIGDLLQQASPYNEPDRDIRLREVLDRAAKRIDGRFPDDPLVEAAIRGMIGNAFDGVGEVDAAQTQLERAFELCTQQLGADDPQTIHLSLKLGAVYRHAHDHEKARRFWTKAEEAANRVLGPNHRDTLEARNDLALLALDRNDVEAALPILRETLAAHRETLGDDHGSTLVSMNVLGNAYERQGKLAEAEALYTECVARSRRMLGAEHPDTMAVIANLGAFYSQLRQFDKAEPLCKEALELRRKVLGDEHTDTLAAMNNLGHCYSSQGRYAECEPLYVKVHEVRRAKLGSHSPETQLSMNNLGILYIQMKHWAEAEPLLVELVDAGRLTNPDSLDMSLSLFTLGGLYYKSDRPEMAEPLMREAIIGYREKMPDGDWRLGSALTLYGACLRRLNRFEEAEQHSIEGYTITSEVFGPHHARTKPAVQALVELYREWDQPEELNLWESRLQEFSQPTK